jgi:hypothetical protein
MKRYRTKAYIVVYESYEACNEGRGGRCGGLQAGESFIVLSSVDRCRNIVAGNIVGWIWVHDAMLVDMERKES